MDVLTAYRKLQAAQEGRAVPAAQFRHVHLGNDAMVVCAYHLSGDLAAPIAFLYGTSRDDYRLAVVGEPRNRDLRFAALTSFAGDVVEWLRPFERTEPRTKLRRGRPPVTTQECIDAPQFVVPNPATSRWLFGSLGRALRYLRTDGDNPVDPLIPLLGGHLTFFNGRRVIPGSCLALVATDVLTQHWITGQTEPEDVNLATALAWVNPPEGLSGVEAAEEAETRLQPAGPVPDPEWDADVLSSVIQTYHDRKRAGASEEEAVTELREVATEALMPAYLACFETMDLVSELPVAASVGDRWESDQWYWSRHVERVVAGEAFFRRVLTPLGAASLLSRAEDAMGDLEQQMALDDPLVMARVLARGEGLSGDVLSVDVDNTEPGRGRATVRRPLVRVSPDESFGRPVGTALFFVDDPRVAATVWDVAADGSVTLRIHAGHGRGRDAAIEALPAVGDRVVFTPFGGNTFFPSTLPAEVPWTHQLPIIDAEGEE